MSALVERLERIRDVIAAAPIDCLGSAHDPETGPAWPIRDEVVDGLSRCIEAAAALRATTGEGEWIPQVIARLREVESALRNTDEHYSLGKACGRMADGLAAAPPPPLRDAGAVGYVDGGRLYQLRNGSLNLSLWANPGPGVSTPLYTHPAPAQVDEARDADNYRWLKCGGWEVLQDPKYWQPEYGFDGAVAAARADVATDAALAAAAKEGSRG